MDIFAVTLFINKNSIPLYDSVLALDESLQIEIPHRNSLEYAQEIENTNCLQNDFLISSLIFVAHSFFEPRN